MVLHLLTPPADEPVTSAELRDFLRLAPEQEETLLQHLLCCAREVVEQQCNLVMLQQSWQLQLNNWPQSGRVAIYKSPVISIDRVQGFDHAGLPVVFGAADWRLDTQSQPQRLYLSRPQHINISKGIVIELTAGFGSTAQTVPDVLRHAILKLAAHFYENRNSFETGNSGAALPPAIEILLAPWLRRRRL